MRKRFISNKSILFLAIIFQITFLCSTTYSYEIRPEDNKNVVRFDHLMGYHKVVDNNDLSIKIEAGLTVKKEVLNYSDNFVIVFKPWKMAYSPHPRNIFYNISSAGKSIVGILNEDGKDNKAYFHEIIVPINEADFGTYNYKRYELFLSYELKNHVTKQGDFYVLTLLFPNMDDAVNNTNNYLELPYTSSVPYRFPEGVNSYRGMVKEQPNGREEIGPWVFQFNDNDRKTFWYYDIKESKEEKMFLLAFGALIGLFLSTLFEVVGPFRRTKLFLLAISFIILIFLVGYYYKM